MILTRCNIPFFIIVRKPFANEKRLLCGNLFLSVIVSYLLPPKPPPPRGAEEGLLIRGDSVLGDWKDGWLRCSYLGCS